MCTLGVEDEEAEEREEINTKLLAYDIRIIPEVSGKVRWWEYTDKTVLGVLVCNLLSCITKGSVLVYSRKTSGGGKGKRKITARSVIKCVDWLEQQGYILNHVAKPQPRKEKRTISWIQPTEKFTNEFPKKETRKKSEKVYVHSVPCVEVRGKDKKPMVYVETEYSKSVERGVRKLNEELDQASIVDVQGNDLTNIYCRLFNESFDNGGRWYRAGILSVRNKIDSARMRIKINDESVVEADYSNLHFRIVAALNGVGGASLPYDIYEGIQQDSTNYTERAIVKHAVNVMFNVKNANAAALAVNAFINAVPFYDKPMNGLGWGKVIVEAVEEKYEEFKHWFYNPEFSALKIQKHESDLAADVIEKLLDKRIAVLPIHDAFICQDKHMDFLMDTMGKCFRERFNHDGLIPIGVKYLENDRVTEQKVLV